MQPNTKLTVSAFIAGLYAALVTFLGYMSALPPGSEIDWYALATLLLAALTGNGGKDLVTHKAPPPIVIKDQPDPNESPVEIDRVPGASIPDGYVDYGHRPSKATLRKLRGVEKRLVDVIVLGMRISKYDFGVISGLRTIEEQRKELEEGDSKILNSRHLHGYAVDIVAYVEGNIVWEEEAWVYHHIADAIRAAAAHLNVPLTWGGDWTDPVDLGHWELPRSLFPDRIDVPLAA